MLSDSLKSIPINEHAVFCVGKSPEILKKSNQHWITFQDFSKIKEFSASEKSILCQIVVENRTQKNEFFVHAEEYVPHLQMFEKRDNKLLLLAETGFNISSSKLSIAKDLQNILLKINPGERKTLLFEIDSYKNELVFNPLSITSKEEHLLANNILKSKLINESSPLILFFIGIHFCLFILGISRMRALYFRPSIFIFIFINFFYIFYYAADYNIISLENKIFPNTTNNDYVNFFGALEPALYYIFFWSYLDRNRIFRRVILFSGIFWLIYYFATNLEWNSLEMIKLSRFIRHFGPIYDLLITATVFVFLLKYKSTFHKYARLGVFVLLISAVQLSYPFILGLFGIAVAAPRFIDENSYFIMYTAIVIDFMLFLYGQNKNEMELQTEKDLMEKQLLQTEVHRQKSILQERRRIAADMHDDLGAGISAIKLHAEYLKKRFPDADLQPDFDELLKTSEDMNLSMREMLWSLNLRNDSVKNFVQYTTTYAENLFRKTPVSLHFETNFEINSELRAEARRNLFLCVKEALNNVCKHSAASKLSIFYKLSEVDFEVIVEDNGVGFSAEAEEGNGLYNIRRRMKEVKGTCIIEHLEKGIRIKLKVLLSRPFVP